MVDFLVPLVYSGGLINFIGHISTKNYLLFAGSAEKFLGNQTHKDYFKLLSTDGTSLLIGARNVVYNLSLPYLDENPEQVRDISKRLSGSLFRNLNQSKNPIFYWKG